MEIFRSRWSTSRVLRLFSCVFLLAACDPSPYGFDSECEKIRSSFQQPPLVRTKPCKDGRPQTRSFTYCKLHEVQRRIWEVTHYPTINSVELLVRTRSIFPWLVRVTRLPFIRIQWKRSMKTELFENALQSGNFWKRCFRVYLWTDENETFENAKDTICSNPLHAILETYSRWRTGVTLSCLLTRMRQACAVG